MENPYGHLAGLKVLETSRLTPGAYCGMLLADAGAEVIKVESPGRGDYARWLPPLVGSQGIPFYVVNRNKRSVEIDLKSPEGQAAMRALVETADIVVEGFRPGVAKRLGISYDQLKAVNPRLICCSISGYGQAGPLSDRSGHDINYLARAGALGLSRDRAGEPVLPGIFFSDYGAGAMAALAIVSAVLGRERTGRGEAIDLSMTDVMVQWVGDALAGALVQRQDEPLAHTRFLGSSAGYNVYRTADDEHMAVGASEPAFWRELCVRLDRADLADADPLAGGAEGERLRGELSTVFRMRTRAEWEEIFSDGRVPCDPVLDLGEVSSSEHVAAREMLSSIETIDDGSLPVPGFAIKFANNPCRQRLAPPDFGEGNTALLPDA